jgi:hypothetical protein
VFLTWAVSCGPPRNGENLCSDSGILSRVGQEHFDSSMAGFALPVQESLY